MLAEVAAGGVARTTRGWSWPLSAAWRRRRAGPLRRRRGRRGSPAHARAARRPARWRPPSPAWCPSRSRSGRCGRRRRGARRGSRPARRWRSSARRRRWGRCARWSGWRSGGGRARKSAEELLAEGRRCVASSASSRPAALPGGLGALDDPGRHAVVVGIGVDLEEAGGALREEEGEGVERPRGAEPAEAGAALLDARSERRGELAAGQAVDAVGGDEQVVAVRRRARRARPRRARRRAATPSSRQRSWRMASSARRESAAKPWPRETVQVPR